VREHPLGAVRSPGRHRDLILSAVFFHKPFIVTSGSVKMLPKNPYNYSIIYGDRGYDPLTGGFTMSSSQMSPDLLICDDLFIIKFL